MAPAPDFPVPVMLLGAAKGGTALFRQGGKLHLTCVLKASFQFVPGGAMKQVSTRDLIRKEVTEHDNPCLSIQASNEVVPYLPRVDVVMTGHASAPTEKWVPRVNVRLAIYHGITLLDKKVHVYGDHTGKEFVLFQRMPLEYERALGGPGHLENPYGTGILPGSKLPNLMCPQDPGAVAGFGPIAQRLPIRASRLGKMTPAALNQSIPEFPDDFDWGYFQAAPADQQLASLVGNEWIVLEGINAEMPRLSSRLPSVRPIATIFGTNPDDPESAQSLQLRIDMLRIDADALRCCVIARGVVQLENDRALSTLRVAGAIETEELSFARMLTPPSKTQGAPLTAMPMMTLRIEEKPLVAPSLNVEESMDVPTMRQGENVLRALSPTGTMTTDTEAKPQQVVVPVIDVNRSLAATLDTYHIDLSKPSERLKAPDEPEWLDEDDLEEAYSVNPLSNPAAFHLGKQRDS